MASIKITLCTDLLSCFRQGDYQNYINTWEGLSDYERGVLPYDFWRFAAVSYDQCSLSVKGRKKVLFQKRAIACIQKALDLVGAQPDVLRTAGMIELHQNNLERATFFYQKAYKINKKDPLSFIALANIFGAQGKYQKAIVWYKKSVPYSSTRLTAYINLAFVYSKTNNIRNAKEYAKKTLFLLKKNKHQTFVSFLPEMERILGKQV